MFSNKEWVSHQLRNSKKDEHEHLFLNPRKRGHVCIEDIVERQPRKKRWNLKAGDPQIGCSKRSSILQEQRHWQDMLDRNETAAIDISAEDRKPSLSLKPAESLQSLAGASGLLTSSSGTHASGTVDTWNSSRPTEELEGRSTTALVSANSSVRLNSNFEHSAQSSHCHPCTTANRDISEDARGSIDFGRSDSIPDSEDEGFWLNKESLDLYFQTGIEIES